MATNNSVNVPLSGNTGTGTFVGANTPTLITPNIGAATGTSLNLGSSTTMTGMIDDDSMATASASLAASSESIKAYVDAQIGGSSDFILISSATASASTYLEFTGLSTTYAFYKLVFDNLLLTTDGWYYAIQVSPDNGSTWRTSGYSTQVTYFTGGAPAYNASGVSAEMLITLNASNVAGETACGEVILVNPAATTRTTIFGHMSYWSNAATAYLVQSLNGGKYNTAETTTAIRISGGNGGSTIASGTVKLYGLRAA
jgi:hypothetical protein